MSALQDFFKPTAQQPSQQPSLAAEPAPSPATEQKPETEPEHADQDQQAQEPSATAIPPADDGHNQKEVVVVYGEKGKGKTFFGLSFPGRLAVLSFDGKSYPIYKKYFRGRDIKIWDVMEQEDSLSPERYVQSNVNIYNDIHNKVMSEVVAYKPDFVIIDGLEIMQRVCENVMRANNNLRAFQGIAARYLWRERRLYMRYIYLASKNASNKGVIYTTYTIQKEIIMDGEVKSRTDAPRWLDAVLYDTDTVIKVDTAGDTKNFVFTATVESSKTIFRTGETHDVSNKGVSALTVDWGVLG